jgi:uncharacterized protein YhaN
MIIRKLQLRHFGKFSDAVFEFRRGLNLVVGPNEAGKSTLMEAIPAVLFGVRDKNRYRSWGRRGESSGALILERPDGILKIERDIESNQVSLEELDRLYQAQSSFSGKVSPQGRSSEARVYSEILEESFGLSDEQLLRASLFFGQGQLELPSQKNFSTRLKALLSGVGSVDYDQVLDSLREELFTLTRQNPWGKAKSRDRELELLNLQLHESLEQLALLRAELDVSDGQRSQADALTEQRHQLVEEINRGETYLAWLRERYALDDQRAALVSRLEDVEADGRLVATLEAELRELDRKLQAAGLTAETFAPAAALVQRERLQAEMHRLAAEGDNSRLELQRHGSPSMTAAVLATVSALTAAAAGLYLRPDWLSLFLAGAGCVAGLGWLVYIRQRLMSRLQKQQLRSRLAALGAQQRQLQSDLQNIDQTLAEQGLGPARQSGSPLQTGSATIQEMLFNRGALVGDLKARPASAALEAKYHELIRELAVVDSRLAGKRGLIAGKDLAPDELAAAGERLQKKRQQLTDLEHELSRFAAQPHKRSSLSREMAVLEEQRDDLTSRLELLQKRIAALQLGHDVLQETVRAYRESSLVRLADAAANKLAVLSSGRYDTIRFDDDLKPYLRTGSRSWKPLEQFSCGTRDMVFLVIRLAFQEMIFAGRKLPLLLDDPFVNLDQERRQKMLSALERLSLEHQVILFSHDPKLLGKAARDRWHVLPLEHQQSHTQPPEEEIHGGQLHLL